MTPERIAELAGAGESEVLEFKNPPPRSKQR